MPSCSRVRLQLLHSYVVSKTRFTFQELKSIFSVRKGRWWQLNFSEKRKQECNQIKHMLKKTQGLWRNFLLLSDVAVAVLFFSNFANKFLCDLAIQAMVWKRTRTVNLFCCLTKNFRLYHCFILINIWTKILEFIIIISHRKKLAEKNIQEKHSAEWKPFDCYRMAAAEKFICINLMELLSSRNTDPWLVRCCYNGLASNRLNVERWIQQSC